MIPGLLLVIVQIVITIVIMLTVLNKYINVNAFNNFTLVRNIKITNIKYKIV